MNFTFSEDQLEFKEAVKGFLAGECTPEHLRKMVESGEQFSHARWQQLAEMGLTGILVPEAQGGLGMTEIDFILLAEQCGYAALPEPLVETAAIAVPLLKAIGGQEKTLERVASGSLVVTVADRRDEVVTTPKTDLMVLTFDGQAFRATENTSNFITSESIDPLRPVSLTDYSGAVLMEGDGTQDIWEKHEERASLMAAAGLVGLSQRMVDMSVAYAQERHQFGKPIGSFQAIKHHLASTMVAIEFVRPVLYQAAYEVTAGHCAILHTSHAKLKASEAAMDAAEVAHQVHGAMGYTYEVDLHLWMKKSWVLTATAGDQIYHEDQIDNLVMTGALDVGPAATFS